MQDRREVPGVHRVDKVIADTPDRPYDGSCWLDKTENRKQAVFEPRADSSRQIREGRLDSGFERAYERKKLEERVKEEVVDDKVEQPVLDVAGTEIHPHTLEIPWQFRGHVRNQVLDTLLGRRADSGEASHLVVEDLGEYRERSREELLCEPLKASHGIREKLRRPDEGVRGGIREVEQSGEGVEQIAEVQSPARARQLGEGIQEVTNGARRSTGSTQGIF